MPNYRRASHPGGTYFFTVNLFERSGNDLLVKHIDALHATIRAVKHSHPFKIHPWVVLPDHVHCVIELPQGDSDFATRWRLIRDFAVHMDYVHINPLKHGLVQHVADWPYSTFHRLVAADP